MVDGDPTVDIAATQAVAEIWKDSEPVSPPLDRSHPPTLALRAACASGCAVRASAS